MNIQTFLLVFIILAVGLSMKYFIPEKQKIQPTTITSLKVIGWIPFWDQEEAFTSFSSHPELFDSIAVFWHSCSPDGQIAVYHAAEVNPNIISFAHEHHVKALATIANLADYTQKETWDPNCVSNIISSKEKREEHITNLVNMVEHNNFDGLVVDYESLPSSQKENYSIFIEELARKLHMRKKILGVTIHPKTSENNPNEDNGSHAQDLQRIAKVADELYYMTYLEHGVFSDPGPPGSIEWIRKVLEYSITDLHIPKEKIYLGVGLTGVTWHQQSDGSYQGESNDNTFQDVLSVAQKQGIAPSWDPASLTPYFIYQNTNGSHIVWFENSRSFDAKVAYAKQLGVTGVALWRLGGEDEGIWDILKSNR